VIPLRRLRETIEKFDFEHQGVKSKTTVSIGVSMNYPNFSNSAEILKTADEALYKAKENGRNRVVAYEQ